MSHLVLNYLNIPDATPAQNVIAAGKGGFSHTGIRLTGHRPGETDPGLVGNNKEISTLRKIMADSGVAVATASTYRFMPDTRPGDYAQVLETAAALAVPAMAVNCFTPDEALAADNLAAVAALAAPLGIKLSLEFIPVSTVKTIADAVRIIGKTGQHNIGINVDALHLQRSGGRAEDLCGVNPSLIHAIHLCDAPLAPPADLFTEMRAGRLYPGAGELPLHALLDSAPTEVEFEVEVPNAALAHLPPEVRVAQAYKATIAFLDDYRQRRARQRRDRASEEA
ncbi:TIM barrel protein [Corticibacterium sp. UT-5YL-CI-8]|nr:TIM barrel protein [Tianweitania sp. UT-5YL-CI-8]